MKVNMEVDMETVKLPPEQIRVEGVGGTEITAKLIVDPIPDDLEEKIDKEDPGIYYIYKQCVESTSEYLPYEIKMKGYYFIIRISPRTFMFFLDFAKYRGVRLSVPKLNDIFVKYFAIFQAVARRFQELYGKKSKN